MKKILLFLLGLLLINSVFSFTVKNIQNGETEFFSLQSSLVKVETQSNLSNLSVKFDLLGNQEERNFSFLNCGALRCLEFELVDLMQQQNNSFLSSNTFELILGNESKTIFLDIVKPNMTLNSNLINQTNMTLNLNFSFNDDLSGIKKVDLFEKNNGNLLFVTSLTNRSIYNLSLKKPGNLTLLFRIEDRAGNINEIEHDFLINDIFLPKIDYMYLEKKESQYLLSFKILDDNLHQYRMGQDGIYLSEDISGSEFEKKVIIPFSSGLVKFEVEDTSGNKIVEEIDLNLNIDVRNLQAFVKSDTFSFTSNADSCILTKLDGNSRNNDFNKNSNSFSLDLGVSNNKEYEIEFLCERNFFRETFSHKFILDTKKPTKSDLSFEARDNGDIYLSWTQSTDENSFVEYTLYRDNKKIYTGNRLNYLDSQGSYPNEYTYYIESSDRAGNIEISNKVNVIPKKDSVFLHTLLPKTLTQNELNYSLFISTDIFADVIVKVNNNDSVIFQREFKKISNRDLEVELDLKLGVNKVEVLVEDEFGNKNSKISSIIVEKKPEDIVVQREPVVQNSIEENRYLELIEQREREIELQRQQNLLLENETKKSGFFNWWALILLLLILLLILALFVHNHPVLREKVIKKFKKTTHFYEKSRKHDMILGKSLQKAKQERIRKQEEAKRKKLEQKEQKRKSEYHSKKLEELSKKRQVFIPLDTRQKAAKKHKRKHKELTHEENLTHSKELNVEKKSLFALFKKQKKEEKTDSFSNYLQKDNIKRRWDSSDSYKIKPEVKKEDENQNHTSLEKIKKEEKQENNPVKTKIDPFKRPVEKSTIQKSAKDKKSFFGFLKQDKKQSIEQNSEEKNKQVIKKQEVFNSEEKINETQPSKKDDISENRKGEALSSLDDYLGKRIKKKRRYFAEKAVEEDLRRRK